MVAARCARFLQGNDPFNSGDTAIDTQCPSLQLQKMIYIHALQRLRLHLESNAMRKMRALTCTLTALIVGGSVLAAEPQHDFTPRNGFGGASEGDGTLTLLLGRPQPFHVESRGTQQADGTFRLEQTISFQGKPPQARVWTMTEVSLNHYTATLSDAAGPVTGTTSGPRLSLQYRVKGPLVMHQELKLLPDGKTIDNVGVITLLGVPVGHLRETITRKGP
ncbi:MAG: DUF3833 family protein [Thermomonas sp.]